MPSNRQPLPDGRLEPGWSRRGLRALGLAAAGMDAAAGVAGGTVMHTLKTEVAGLPAGTPYEIYEIPGAPPGRRVAWVVGGLRVGRRIDRIEKRYVCFDRASLEVALALFGAYVAGLGVDPETPAPCGRCGSEIAACLTLCPECGQDPVSETPCTDCEDGHVDICRGPHHLGRVTCGTCGGRLSYESADYRRRVEVLERARARQRKDAGVPVPEVR